MAIACRLWADCEYECTRATFNPRSSSLLLLAPVSRFLPAIYARYTTVAIAIFFSSPFSDVPNCTHSAALWSSLLLLLCVGGHNVALPRARQYTGTNDDDDDGDYSHHQTVTGRTIALAALLCCNYTLKREEQLENRKGVGFTLLRYVTLRLLLSWLMDKAVAQGHKGEGNGAVVAMVTLVGLVPPSLCPIIILLHTQKPNKICSSSNGVSITLKKKSRLAVRFII